jgi:hypothetical protein
MLAFDRQATRLAWVASLQAAQEQLHWQGVVDNHRRGIAARDLSIRIMLDRQRDDVDNLVCHRPKTQIFPARAGVSAIRHGPPRR